LPPGDVLFRMIEEHNLAGNTTFIDNVFTSAIS
jgi:hypothetical protein